MSTHQDRLAKCVLEETLDPVGLTRREFEVDPGFLQRMDFLFIPLCLPPRALWPPHLALIYEMVDGFLNQFEAFCGTVDADQMLDCHCKQMNLRHRQRYKPPQEPGSFGPMPQLWVLTAGYPRKAFVELQVEEDPGKPKGFYRMAPWCRMRCVVLSELALTRETLVLRLMGPRAMREQALQEVGRMGPEDPEFEAVHKLVSALRHAVERDRLIPQEDREEFMTEARAEVEKMIEQATRQGYDRALVEAIQQFWSLRFGVGMPEPLAQQVWTIQDRARLREVQAVVAKAPDAQAATAQLTALTSH